MKYRLLFICCLSVLFLNCNNPAPKQEAEELSKAETDNEGSAILTNEKTVEAEETISSSNDQKPKADAVQKVEKQSAPKLKPDAPTTPPQAAKKATVTEQVSTDVKKVAPPAIVTAEEPAKPLVPVPPAHELWNELLQKYVTSDGTVNYKGIKANSKKLEQYLNLLAENPIQEDWSRNEKMAYWINAYNAFTVKLIVDNYPVTSITKLHGGKPWDVKWIKLGDKTYSLNNIENDILRPKFKDARIHFAVNCAAQSCPPLLNKAWTAANLNRYFDQQAKQFINNSRYNKITPDAIQISKIFEWYAGDFDNIIAFLNKFSETTISEDAKVSYLEYNWSLNE